MNRKMILNTLRKMLFFEGFFLIVPMIVSMIYNESWWPFAVTAAGLFVIGGIGNFKTDSFDQTIYSKDGFFIVGLVWILWSVFGALPFVISGSIPNFFDAFFETVSGFTTTGSSILTNIESLPKGMLFWRSFTHWVGGMGVLVFVSAIIPLARGRSMFILKAEMPGPSADKLVPKTKDTAQILYLIYFVLTTLQIALLIIGDMPVYDAFVTAFGTAGTGGFSVKNAGIGAYNNPFAEIVITVFMILFAVNFNVYFFILMRKFKNALRNEELWLYLSIIFVSIVTITLNIMTMSEYAGNASDAIRDSSFQVASVISSTGFSTADFSMWPQLSQSVLLILMFIGACAGSTGGGMKVVRLLLLGKIIKRDMRKIVHPRTVKKIRMNNAAVEEDMISGVKTYLLIYFVIVFGSFIILSFEGKDILTTFTSVVTTFNNIGPGLGTEVGPAGNFASWSAFSKIILSFDMLLGRLEIYPILILLMPSLWKKRSL